MKKIIFSLLFLTTLLSACSDDDDSSEPISIGLEYYPLALNQESIYQVDSIIYDDFTGRVDTFRHQQRERVEEQILDEENRVAFEIGIYTRANDTSVWRKIKVIRRTRTNRRLEILEDNTVRIDLVFPIVEGVRWNPNTLNTNEEQLYSFSSVNQPYELNGMNFDSTLVVNQIDRENLIERVFAEERFAVRRGLIERTYVNLETEVSGEIRRGSRVSIQLLSFQ